MSARALWIVVAVVGATACQSSAERARLEMQSVYRAAKNLDEQMKAGAELKELQKLRGTLATELGIVHDRMLTKSSSETVLRSHYASYQAVLDSFALVLDERAYSQVVGACMGGMPEVTPPERSNSMSLGSRIAEMKAFDDFLHRGGDCIRRYHAEERSLIARAKQLGMECPDIYPDGKCFVGYAEAKLATAENLMRQPAPSEAEHRGSSSGH